ncbi:MAG: endonuclease domain-containing protein [Anaerolineaceae bacterium]|nr:endonuclease domain-containing protein [Anaerolineaceae bacterium]
MSRIVKDPERNRLKVPEALRRKMVEAAREFRKEPTPSEELLWQALRGKKLDGIKFRRQQPIGPFVVDFYAPAIRLVIEIDGAIHQQQQEADQNRQQILESLDLNVIRFSASQVENEIETVLSTIHMNSEPPLSVYRRGAGGEGTVGKAEGQELHGRND